MTVLGLGRAKRLPYIVSYRQPQRSRYDEEVVRVMSFTEYRDSPLLNTFDLLKDRYAFFQNRRFEQPCIATLGQEVG